MRRRSGSDVEGRKLREQRVVWRKSREVVCMGRILMESCQGKLKAENRGRLKALLSCLRKREILRRKFAPEKGYQDSKVHSSKFGIGDRQSGGDRCKDKDWYSLENRVVRVRRSFEGGKGIEKQVEEYKVIKEDWTVQG